MVKKLHISESMYPYTIWVFDAKDARWHTWGGSHTPTVKDDFLYKINHPNFPNPEYNVENSYTDVTVLPAGELPDDGRPIKESNKLRTEVVNTNWLADELRNSEGIQKGDKFVGLAYVRNGRTGEVSSPLRCKLTVRDVLLSNHHDGNFVPSLRYELVIIDENSTLSFKILHDSYSLTDDGLLDKGFIY